MDAIAPDESTSGLHPLRPYLLLGLVAGGLAPVFLRLLDRSEDLFCRITLPVYVRMALGGLIVGALAMLHPDVCGNGYSAINAILHGQWVWQTLAVILLFKVLATSATFGSGAVGGVFTPTLFIGASLGFLFGAFFHEIFRTSHLHPSACALVGIGAFLAGTTHTPVMAIMMIFEMTLDYQISLPLMLACVLAYYTASRIEPRSIYSESIKRKGGGRFSARLVDVNVGDLMKRDPVSVLPNDRFGVIAERFLANRFNYLYVADENKDFLGAISLHDVKNHLTGSCPGEGGNCRRSDAGGIPEHRRGHPAERCVRDLWPASRRTTAGGDERWRKTAGGQPFQDRRDAATCGSFADSHGRSPKRRALLSSQIVRLIRLLRRAAGAQARGNPSRAIW